MIPRINIFTPPEREAWHVPPPLKPSEWAEEYLVLPQDQSAHPGPWRNELTPYLRGLMDLCVAPGVERIAAVKAGQMGYTRAALNLIAYWASREPDPMGVAFPDEKTGKFFISNRVAPMMRYLPILKPLLPAKMTDMQKSQIKLNNSFILHLMWSGSAASTAGNPMRRVICDEVDKFQEWGGAEPNPVGRTWTRMRTYTNRKMQINISTPTLRTGQIYTLFTESTYQLYFLVPCPRCGKRIPLIFQQLKYLSLKDESRKETIEWIKDQGTYYICQECGGRIEEKERDAMVKAGKWGTLDGKITDAEAVEKWPQGTTLGLQCGGLYCLWETWRNIAVLYVEALGDRHKQYTFRTETLGLPFEDLLKDVKASVYDDKVKCATHDEGIVPLWGQKLIATVDTQHDHFYVVVRAWGAGMRSQRVYHGILHSFEDVRSKILNYQWPIEDGRLHPMRVELLLIDSGGTKLKDEEKSRTTQVYEWVQRVDDRRVLAIKGAASSKEGLPFWRGREYANEQNARKDRRYRRIKKKKTAPNLYLWWIDVLQCQDVLTDLITVGTGDTDEAEMWHLNRSEKGKSIEYNLHMGNMQKVPVGRKQEPRWVPKEASVRIDYRDCYDEETEVLTRGGWKYFKNIDKYDILATVNIEKDLIEYQQPSEIISKWHCGDMVKIGGERGSRLDMLVTPNHRMVCLSQRGNINIRKACELTKNSRLKTASNWIGTGVEYYELPATRYDEKKRVDAEHLAEFLGWYIAEGCCQSIIHRSQPSSIKRRVVIYQNEGEGREVLRRVLGKMPWGFNETDRGFVISRQQAYNLVRKLGDKYTKFIPQWIKDASPNVIEAYLRGAIAGDGWVDNGREWYATVSKRLADDIQELFLKVGSATVMKTRKAKPYNIRGRYGENTVDQYHVSRKLTKQCHLNRYGKDKIHRPIFKNVHYDGMVYCATVPNGTLIVRRNGKVVICGNCEVYQVAAAYMLFVHMLPQAGHFQKFRERQIAELENPKPIPKKKKKKSTAWEQKSFDHLI